MEQPIFDANNAISPDAGLSMVEAATQLASMVSDIEPLWDTRGDQAIWATLSEEQRIAAAAVIIPIILEHARDGGSFRYLIYDRLGFSMAAYLPLCMAGVMEASNELGAAGDDTSPALATALRLVADQANKAPLVPSGIKRDDGSDILTASPERNDWFRASYTLNRLAARAALQQNAYRKLQAEYDALLRAVVKTSGRDGTDPHLIDHG